MKRVLPIILSSILALMLSVNVFAAQLDENEQYVIEQLQSSEFSETIKPEYVYQLENYLYRDNVSLDSGDAKLVVEYIKDAIILNNQMKEEDGTLNDKEAMVKYCQKAATILKLHFVYDTKFKGFYLTDKQGMIVIDSGKIIKDTGNINKNRNRDEQYKYDYSISVTAIFVVIVTLCFIGILVNAGKWYRKLHKHSSSSTNDEEYEQEEHKLEIADKKTRKKKMNTFTYSNVKQFLKYCYVSIVMYAVLLLVGFCAYSFKASIVDSVSKVFLNYVGVVNTDGMQKYTAATQNTKTVETVDMTWPIAGLVYGEIKCDKLEINTYVCFGDRGEWLAKGAGTYIGSSIPGNGKTILVGGHNSTVFAGLENVEDGDEFTFTTTYGIYTYKVSDIKIVDKDETENAYDLGAEGEKLILYTCYPFGTLNGSLSQRMFVYLDLVSGPKLVNVDDNQ